MSIEQLNNSHREAVRSLFEKSRHMGTTVSDNFMERAYTAFCDTYLTGLNSFKAYGYIKDGIVLSYIAFFESNDSAEWYWTQIKSKDNTTISDVLDEVIKYHESNGRLKFYSMFNRKYEKSYRRLTFSKSVSERYGFFDEYIVPSKNKCYYLTAWHVLFNRMLMPVDTIVRCTFLKQEYRKNLPIAGGL